jgi:hypothetical protein
VRVLHYTCWSFHVRHVLAGPTCPSAPARPLYAPACASRRVEGRLLRMLLRRRRRSARHRPPLTPPARRHAWKWHGGRRADYGRVSTDSLPTTFFFFFSFFFIFFTLVCGRVLLRPGRAVHHGSTAPAPGKMLSNDAWQHPTRVRRQAKAGAPPHTRRICIPAAATRGGVLPTGAQCAEMTYRRSGARWIDGWVRGAVARLLGSSNHQTIIAYVG